MSNIFISYNRKNEAIVKTLADDIGALGHTLWFDQELSGGQAWWDQILTKIRDCDVFVFILAPEALNSTACKRENEYAAALGKTILPVLVAEGMSTNLLPPALSQIHFVDYRKQDRDSAFRLARALISVPPPKPLPDPLPDPPEVPLSYLGRLTEQIGKTSTLSYEEQSTMVVDLKRSLRDPEASDDARMLLESLRKRRDLLATIAEEIDELLGSTRKAASAPPRTSEPELSPQKHGSPQTSSSELVTAKAPMPSTAVPSQESGARRTPWKRWVFSPLIFISFSLAGFGAGAGVASVTGSEAAGFIGAVPTWLAGIVVTYLVWRRY